MENEILVEMKSIGLNFADIMRRSGSYPVRGKAPYINGFEGAGIVRDPNGQAELSIGDRVAFADVPFANAELVAVPYDNLIPSHRPLSSNYQKVKKLMILWKKDTALEKY